MTGLPAEYGDSAIAITGMACRFPGADDPDAFWTLLREGRSAVRALDEAQLRAAGVAPETFRNPAYVAAASEIDGIDLFDAASFAISEREAALTDPQQRVLLECALHALEDAGRARETDGLKTGVFVGVGINGYLVRNLHRLAVDDDPMRAFEVLIGSDKDYAASRIAYRLGLTGPAMTVNTACSTSLVCVYQAFRSLLAYDCDVALAGACKLNFPAGAGYLHRPGGILSADGRCRAFDADGTGPVFGSGAGAVVLRRLRDALDDGDPIHAVVLAGAVNNDGARKVGFIAPSAAGQAEVVAEALAVAGVDAGRIGYVEAHGTGTSLGDPIEIAALEKAFRRSSQRTGDCPIGSVKTNIGHLETAAGMAGLIKVVLALRHEAIPPSLHFEKPNPQIDFARSPFFVNTALRPWPRGDAPRLAGVSSFGIGGTNAHLIVAEAPSRAAPAREGAYTALTLSADSEAGLRRLRERTEAHLHAAQAAGAADDTIDLCHTSQVGRRQRAWREAFVGASRAELLERMREPARRAPAVFGVFGGRAAKAPKLAFLFGGQGARYPDMARDLYLAVPAFRERLDRADALYRRAAGEALIERIWAADGRALETTEFAQPAVFAIQVALAESLIDCGLRPSCVAGHSVGEYAAACVAGLFDLETGLRLLVERGRAMAQTPPGRMLAVDAPAAQIREWLERFPDELAVAAYNGPDQTVVSGTPRATDAVLREAPHARALPVDRAFHSPLMREVPQRLGPLLHGVSLAAPRIAFVTAGGDGLSPQQTEYWLRHIVDPVQFSTILDRVAQSEPDALFDLTPRATLAAIGARHPQLGERPWLRCLDPRRAGPAGFADALAQAFALGTDVDWDRHLAHVPKRRVPLPAYPFERRRHWIDAPAAAPAVVTPEPAAAPLRDTFVLRWRPAPRRAPMPLADDHAWIVLADRGGIAQALAQRLREAGFVCYLVAGDAAIEPALAQCAQGASFTAIDLRAVDLDSDACDRDDADPVQALAPIVGDCLRTLAAHERRLRAYWLVTARAQAAVAGADAAIEPLGSALWGLGRTVREEYPQCWGGLIDLDGADPAHAADFVFEEVRAGRSQVEVAKAGDARLEPELVRHALDERACGLRADAVYLVVGGLGALGLAVARRFAALGARHLVLSGRRLAPERSAAIVAEFAALGVEVRTLAADIGSPEQVRALIEQTVSAAQGRPLAGIVHAAGELRDRLVRDLDWPRFAESLAAKIGGAWALDRQTRAMALDFVVVFSSIAGVFGSPGQSAYAAANAWLDGFAQRRHARGARTLAIAWGPWDGEGMAGRLDERTRARIETTGLAFIDPASGLSSLEHLLAADAGAAAHTVAMALHPGAAAHDLPAIARAAIAGADEPEASAAALSASELLALPPAQRAARMREHLAGLLARTLGAAPAACADDVDMVELGMDSLVAMGMIRSLRDELGIMIYPREIYEHRSLRAFADYLLAQIAAPGAEADEAPALPQRPATRRGRSDIAQRLPGVAFILSAPRSGSTLLRAMTAGHSRLFAPPELHLLPFASMRERERELASTHLGEGLQRAIMELQGVDAAAAAETVRAMVVDDYPIHRVYQWLIERAGDRMLVDKSPTYGLERATLERAEALFEGARYVHLLRQPQAMIESFARMRMHKLFAGVAGGARKTGENVWRTCNANIAGFLAGVDPQRQRRVSYEELVRAPESVLGEVCATLGVELEPGIFDPYGEGRMNDGVHAASLPIGDPNFGRRDRIDRSLAERWRAQPAQPLEAETIALSAALGYAPARAPAAPAAVAAVERDYRSGDFRLRLSQWGPGDAPPVVCIHGAMEHGHTWERLAAELVPHGLRLLAPDLRGHGLSEHQRPGNALSMHDWLLDLDALLEQEDLREVQLIGHSMGSVLAASLAAARPERIRAAMLVEPILPTPLPLGQRLQAQLQAHRDAHAHQRFDTREQAVERLLSVNPDLQRDEAETLAVRGLTQNENGWTWRWDPRLKARAFAIDADPEQYLALLSALDRQVTVVRGFGSPFGREADIRRIDEALHRSERHLLRGAHHPHIRSAQDLARIVLEQRRTSMAAQSNAVKP